MTEKDVQNALGRYFMLKDGACIPNVLLSYGRYEADFIRLNLCTREFVEIEIKLNISDFRADFKKKHYHDHPSVSMLYYAMPTEMYLSNKDEIDKMLGDAGLILVNSSDGWHSIRKITKRAKRRKNIKPLCDSMFYSLLRVGCMKWINR